MPIPYQTLEGLRNATLELREVFRRTDLVMHEINSKVMPTGSETLKSEWLPLYSLWVAFAKDHSLKQAEPRLSMDDLKIEHQKIVRMKTDALKLYATWKKEHGVSGEKLVVEIKKQESGVLRTSLILAALFGGAAALHTLYLRWKGKPDPAALPPPEPENMQESLSHMSIPALYHEGDVPPEATVDIDGHASDELG